MIWVCFMLLDVLLLLPPEPRTGIPGRHKYCTAYIPAEVVVREVTARGQAATRIVALPQGTGPSLAILQKGIMGDQPTLGFLTSALSIACAVTGARALLLAASV